MIYTVYIDLCQSISTNHCDFCPVDCVECMACSDNVVRAGLTPKFKDIPLLCSMLNYDSKPGTKHLFPGSKDPEDVMRVTFNPPVAEFTVDKIKVCVVTK